MSKRQHLVRQMGSLKEIREIMNSMKTLSMMENRKLGNAMPQQDRIVKTTEMIASDFICHYPLPQQIPATAPLILVLIGSERGFCGDFNDRLTASAMERLQQRIKSTDTLIAVGSRLRQHLFDVPCKLVKLDGASVSDEVPQVLQQVLDTIEKLQLAPQSARLEVLYFHHERLALQLISLVPPFVDLQPTESTTAFPPLLNMKPAEFFTELMEQYLFYRLYQVFYSSLKAENQRRVMHLDSAIARLDEDLDQLLRQGNRMRQEEITEEIEIILLNSSTPRNTETSPLS